MQKSIFTGTIGKDAIVHTIGRNTYAKFSIAVNDGKDENGQRKTLWLDVLKYDKDGKLTPYLVKKAVIAVDGRLAISAYVNKEGQAVPSVTLWCNELEFISSPKKEAVQESAEDADDLPTEDAPF